MTRSNLEIKKDAANSKNDPVKDKQFNKWIVLPLIFVSMAGWMFGADTGTISGLINMPDYQRRFGNCNPDGVCFFSPARQGLVVGMVNIGTFFGCFLSAYPSEHYGKKKSIMGWCAVYTVGLILQITAFNTWVQVMIARIVTGLAIGALSVVAPSYQSETSPKSIRGSIVTSYQLFVTLGILVGYLINYGTNKMGDTQAAWRIPIGINFVYGFILAIGMLFLPESPRFLLKNKQPEECRKVLAKIRGTNVDDPFVEGDFVEIQENLAKENTGGRKWRDCFDAEVRYRTFLGIAVMSFQQLCGANFFFYFGTNIFTQVRITNNFVAQIILGAVNFGTTFGGLYILERFGRRWPLIIGGIWMFMCFMVFASVGHYKIAKSPDPTTERSAGLVLIVFACLFIAGFATTWAPAAYVIVGESFPLRVRAKCAAIATAANYFWNFLISFFTGFIVEAIDYKYGYVFACCCLAGAATIFFFAMETKGLSLEEIDELYASDTKPWQSAGWKSHLHGEKKALQAESPDPHTTDLS